MVLFLGSRSRPGPDFPTTMVLVTGNVLQGGLSSPLE